MLHKYRNSQEIGDKIEYRYGKAEVEVPEFTEYTTEIGGTEHVGKGIINCGDIEIQNKHECGIKETRIMKVKSGTEKEEIIEQHL